MLIGSAVCIRCTCLHCLLAAGGADEPEDVFGGLEQLSKLEWRTTPAGCRQIYHIADAPCHGTQYHDLLDDYPSGDPNGRDLATLLNVLQKDKQVCTACGCSSCIVTTAVLLHYT